MTHTNTQIGSCSRLVTKTNGWKDVLCCGILRMTVLHPRELYPQETLHSMSGKRQEGHNSSVHSTSLFVTTYSFLNFLHFKAISYFFLIFLDRNPISHCIRNSWLPDDFKGVNIHISLENILLDIHFLNLPAFQGVATPLPSFAPICLPLPRAHTCHEPALAWIGVPEERVFGSGQGKIQSHLWV